METNSKAIGRRTFVGSAAAAAGATTFFPRAAAAQPKYIRYSVTSPEGQKALASYAKGVQAMVNLSPNDPWNWFRNAFVHLLDCPHGNWWFYVWHRGYLGFFEETIRRLSGDQTFALPFWDWTTLPKIPPEMFHGALDPTSSVFQPYTKDLATFTAFIQAPMQSYWNGLNQQQKQQQTARGYNTFNDVWTSVSGGGDPANGAFATTAKARYLSASNPNLDPTTAHDCSAPVVTRGLKATKFYSATRHSTSFNSTKTVSHATEPDDNTWFSVLEGLPHNNVHNNIGGVPAWNPGPYGYMTQFLSPCDPVFFLHHANMDRLWDIWTRRQKAMGKPWTPDPQDASAYMTEPFRFFVDMKGTYLTNAKAADFFDTSVFGYAYGPGFGDSLIPAGAAPAALMAEAEPAARPAKIAGSTATVSVPNVSASSELSAVITMQAPAHGDPNRQFHVLVNAPAGVRRVGTDDPHHAGTISFFGPAHHVHGNASFVVPLTRVADTVKLGANGRAASAPISISVVPDTDGGKPPALVSVSVEGQ